MEYEVVQHERITPTVIQLTLRPTGVRKLDFEAGQYAALSFKRNGWWTPTRSFSIINNSSATGELQFAIKIGGTYTQAVAQMPIGTCAKVQGPFGSFSLERWNVGEDIVFMAGGIGITPIISMIHALSQYESRTNITLLYSNRLSCDVPFAYDIKAMEVSNPRLRVAFLISDVAPGLWLGVGARRLSPELLDQTLGGQYGRKIYYICGPAGYMALATRLLKARGVLPSQIVLESFAQGSSQQTKLASLPARVYAGTAVSILLMAGAVATSDFNNALAKASAAQIEAQIESAQALAETESARIRAVNEVARVAQAEAQRRILADQNASKATPGPTSSTTVAAPIATTPARTPFNTPAAIVQKPVPASQRTSPAPTSPATPKPVATPAPVLVATAVPAPAPAPAPYHPPVTKVS